MSGRAQTGPKGVIADHREHMRRQQAAKQQRDRDLMAKLNKQSMGLTLRQPESKTFRAGGETDAACSRLSKSDDDDDDLDDDDDIAMAAYREQRLREIMDKRASRGYGKDTVHGDSMMHLFIPFPKTPSNVRYIPSNKRVKLCRRGRA